MSYDGAWEVEVLVVDSLLGNRRETVIEERLELVSLINMGSVIMEAGRSDKIVRVVHVVDMIIESGHEKII